MTKIFIDGSSGTTGLKIHKRLEGRKDIDLIILPDELRKDKTAVKDALNSCDVAFLCLPDDAAREAAALLDDQGTVIIDTSTAHRTSDDWVYGFSELTGYKKKIASSKRIANPGCHASGFISLISPLVENGIISTDAFLSCYSLTGYSGGGKKMIAEYESEDRSKLLKGPRIYGLGQMHKHIPEMIKITGMKTAPAFCPVVCDFYSGMESSICLQAEQINGNIDKIKEVYKDYYRDSRLIRFNDDADENGFLSAAAFSGLDSMEISVFGNAERILLVSRFDNLGKGASGAAIQNMNIVIGADETEGLVL